MYVVHDFKIGFQKSPTNFMKSRVVILIFILGVINFILLIIAVVHPINAYSLRNYTLNLGLSFLYFTNYLRTEYKR